MNARLPSLVLLFLACAWPLRAEDSSGGLAVSNVVPPATLDLTGQVGQATSAPAQIVATVPGPNSATNSAGQTTPAPPVILSEPERAAPVVNPGATTTGMKHPAGEFLMWLALLGATVISLAAVAFTWRMSRRSPAATPAPARAEPPAMLAPNLLPVISQAIKEALMQELAAQRRELLSAQQAAAAELASLARRLEAVQTPLLERLGGLRASTPPATQFQREIPVKIYCGCGQKYSFEVQPVSGRMPFPVVCPACGQDGTHQANQAIVRSLNGLTQALPMPGVPAAINSAPSGVTPQLVDAVKQAVVKELAASSAEAPKAAPVPVARENHNGAASSRNHADDFMASLVAEGQALADAGELDKAVKCFDTALALQPDRADTLVKLGGALDKLDRTEEALRHYDRAIALDESLTIAYLNKGGLFNRLARYDEALRCYEQALHKQKRTAA